MLDDRDPAHVGRRDRQLGVVPAVGEGDDPAGQRDRAEERGRERSAHLEGHLGTDPGLEAAVHRRRVGHRQHRRVAGFVAQQLREQQVPVAVPATGRGVGAVGQDDREGRAGPSRRDRLAHRRLLDAERLAPLPDEATEPVGDLLADLWRASVVTMTLQPSSGTSIQGCVANTVTSSTPGSRSSSRAIAWTSTIGPWLVSWCSDEAVIRILRMETTGRISRPSPGPGSASPARRSRSNRCGGRSGSRRARWRCGHQGGAVAVHVEGGDDRDVRADDLAHRARMSPLGVVDRLGRHRAVEGEHHAVDVFEVLAGADRMLSRIGA